MNNSDFLNRLTRPNKERKKSPMLFDPKRMEKAVNDYEIDMVRPKRLGIRLAVSNEIIADERYDLIWELAKRAGEALARKADEEMLRFIEEPRIKIEYDQNMAQHNVYLRVRAQAIQPVDMITVNINLADPGANQNRNLHRTQRLVEEIRRTAMPFNSN